MEYRDDMSSEKKPSSTLPAGDRLVTITRMEDKVSKAGNSMFLVNLKDYETGDSMDIFLVREKGKRWFLKGFLAALGVVANEAGEFVYDPDLLVGRGVIAKVEHYEEDWINREGNSVKLNKARVVEFMKYNNDKPISDPASIKWEE